MLVTLLLPLLPPLILLPLLVTLPLGCVNLASMRWDSFLARAYAATAPCPTTQPLGLPLLPEVYHT